MVWICGGYEINGRQETLDGREWHPVHNAKMSFLT